MRQSHRSKIRLLAVSSAAALMLATAANAQDGSRYEVAGGDLKTALQQFAGQSDREILFSSEVVAGRSTHGVRLEADAPTALARLLEGTGLTFRQTETGTLLVVQQDPQGGSAAGSAVQALIVTAQKREEDIQDVPIAISAFSQEDLTTRQVAGGPDLITQVPNFTFTKTNFTGYSIQIRGIGTQAISATTDPAVAVAFNNTPFIRNRFFEQEFYDLERVEVLRGPQGTLYGRNATAGVVNLIAAKPSFYPEAKVSADVANYSSRRLEAMVNLPLVEDVAALRLAGAWTKREGFATNQMTGGQIDGRDLWSTRVSLRIEPTDHFSANLVWEHFEEDDDRLRSGKQLCKKDLGPDKIGDLEVPPNAFGGTFGLRSYISQGCSPVSLYSDEAFQTPNGFALPFYGPTGNIGNGVKQNQDPYLNAYQSRDLRVIESTLEPDYRAKSDIGQLQLSWDITPGLSLDSETAYSTDFLWSFQDYNRFTTAPQAFTASSAGSLDPGVLDANGVFCDPQLGCSDRLLLGDLSTAKSTQFSQEFRLSSDFEGAFNFSLGANFLRYDTEDKYYVFINSLTMLATVWDSSDEPYVAGVTDNAGCAPAPNRISDPFGLYNVAGCTYIDPNPIGSLNDKGRNYFLSKNPYKLISYAAFGEAYYQITPALKLTAGLRFTVDRKHAPQIPSWMLAAGTTGEYPAARVIDQEWREPTGRLTLDWKPDLSFTDETLLYASYAHGYKAGGANPPPPVVATYAKNYTDEIVMAMQTHPLTFEPEYVDAFEVGAKNTLLDGTLTLNLGAFFYDYKGYQISEIIDRSAVNSNYDAKIWGAELEAEWRPLDNLILALRGGYQDTRIADGTRAIDLMDRTAGDPNWVLVRPFPTVPSNCILPVYVATAGGRFNLQTSYYNVSASGACVDAYYSGLDPVTGDPYEPGLDYGALLGPAFADYEGFDPTTAPNGGAGIKKDLSGNELPNAPHWTANVTADYTLPLPNAWLMTLHADFHWQSEAWARVFNSDPYDRIESYATGNVAAIFQHDGGWKVMAYVKNVTDETAITGAFLNSDDTGLTTNVFLTEPRLYGVRITREWGSGSPLDWSPLAGGRDGRPPLLTVELGGAAARQDAPNEAYRPDFASEFDPGVLPLGTENRDLDWGDQREVKVTYNPVAGWHVSAALRYGRTNATHTPMVVDPQPGGKIGALAPDKYQDHPGNYGTARSVEREDYHVADFAVGKDVGLGSARSTVSLGLRYAELNSDTMLEMAGLPDLYLPPDNILYYVADYHRAKARLQAERGFSGTGPAVTWDGDLPLFGDDDAGKVSVDWSVTGGVLFGKQDAKVSYDSEFNRYNTKYITELPEYTLGNPFEQHPTSGARNESRDVTVPTVGASLGLAYQIQGLKVSGGYRWERYFDAIDGGVAKASSYDRTIDGPYFKVSIGFGG